MKIPRFIKNVTPGFKVIDVKEWISRGRVEIYLERKESNKPKCRKCGSTTLGSKRGKYFVRIKTMPLFNLETYLCLWRHKYHCSNCGKARSEDFDFVSPETPHLSREYSYWIGRLCEITSVKQAAEFSGNDKSSVWRMDYSQMKRRFQNYKPPKARRISVDEVYARRKKYSSKESRDKRFFTIVCDLDTRKVIWVSESRSKEALDEYFHIIGPEACRDIEVVAADQHDPYKASVNENCPNAVFVWDRFHIMQSFDQALNEDRMWLHQHAASTEVKRLTRSKFKTLFIKKADRRTNQERRHISDVLEDNKFFAYLELIKEAMFEVYASKSEMEARKKFLQIKEWLKEGQFYNLSKWWENLNKGWGTFKNYFKHRVSSSLSEGINNVIKTVKKRAYGYRNMQYFKLKILQVCGYLNSKYIPTYF